MTRIELAKQAASTAVGISSSFVIASIIRNNTTPNNKVQEAEVVVASFVLGSLVAEHAKTYTNRQIDAAVEWWNDNVKK